MALLKQLKNIRKAISYCIPRQYLIETLFEGLGAPATTAVPDSVLGYDDTLVPYAYDLETARDLMEDAGYTIRTEITPTGITGLLFISFLGLASLLAFRRFKK